MTKVITVFLAIALSLPAVAFAQNGQQDDKNTQSQQNQSAMANQMGADSQPQRQMSGMVSNNGKTLTSNDKAYVVNNPKALKGYDDKSVAVAYQFNTDNNTIHIISVRPAP